MNTDELEERIIEIEDDVYGQEPESPGVILRIDRMERMLSTMFKLAVVLGGLSVTWKVADVLYAILGHRANP